jgi:hypothetical protein
MAFQAELEDMKIIQFQKASRFRPVSGHRQVMESVENERSAFALRAHTP